MELNQKISGNVPYETYKSEVLKKVFAGERLSDKELEFIDSEYGEYDSDVYDVVGDYYLTVTYQVIYKIENRFFRTFYNWDGESKWFDSHILEEVITQEVTRTEYVAKV